MFASERSWRRLQDMSSRRLQDMSFKMSWRSLQRNNFSSSKTSWRRPTRGLENVFKTSSRRLGRPKIVTLKMSSRHLEDQKMFAGKRFKRSLCSKASSRNSKMALCGEIFRRLRLLLKNTWSCLHKMEVFCTYKRDVCKFHLLLCRKNSDGSTIFLL